MSVLNGFRTQFSELRSEIKYLDDRLRAARRGLDEQITGSRAAVAASRALMKRADDLMGNQAGCGGVAPSE